MKRWMTALAALACVPATGLAQQAHSPYAHQGSEEVKTLSQEEVDRLLAGEGMGLARPAELNGYPGPKHVLELADSLGLTAEQRSEVEGVFASMHERAQALGREILAGERSLDAAFAERAITEADLSEGVERIARLQGELRVVHLRAHLETRALLSPHQIHEYDRLRGYGAGHVHPSR
jgi:hypothetical protein